MSPVTIQKSRILQLGNLIVLAYDVVARSSSHCSCYHPQLIFIAEIFRKIAAATRAFRITGWTYIELQSEFAMKSLSGKSLACIFIICNFSDLIPLV